MILRTPRLLLRHWQETDRDSFATLNADPEVARDLGGPLSRAESDAKFDRYVTTFTQRGFARWAIEDTEGRFVGYAGVMPSSPDHTLRPHAEIGWRLVRSAWRKGYATEAARAALRDFFTRTGFAEVLSYTSSENARSQAVMERLGLQREPSLDFSGQYGGKVWHGLVWVAAASDVSLTAQ